MIKVKNKGTYLGCTNFTNVLIFHINKTKKILHFIIYYNYEDKFSSIQQIIIFKNLIVFSNRS